MKRIHYVGIILILLVLVGLFVISPFSPLNKTSFDGHTVNLPSGYTILNTTNSTMLALSNGTNNMYMFSTEFTDTDEALKEYHKTYDKKYNVTKKDVKMDNGETIIKTTAKPYNGTKTMYKYWFIKDKKVYNMQTNNPVNGTEDIIKSMISSY